MGDLGCSLALSRGSTVLTQESSKASPAKAAGSLQGITVTADRQGASLDTLSVAPWFLPLASSCAVIAAAILGCTAAFAGEDLDSRQGAVTEAPQTTGLQEVVVTAERRSESAERAPLSITALTQDMLQKRAITSETDLQAAVPGLTVRETLNGNSLNFAIRGQSIDTFSNSPSAVLQYFNEVQINPQSATPFYDLVLPKN
jgi:outer membrane receptor protein involved in Fe transport